MIRDLLFKVCRLIEPIQEVQFLLKKVVILLFQLALILFRPFLGFFKNLPSPYDFIGNWIFASTKPSQLMNETLTQPYVVNTEV
jgi:hypothetical protein